MNVGLGVAGRWALTFRGYLQFKERKNKNDLEVQREETEGGNGRGKTTEHPDHKSLINGV